MGVKFVSIKYFRPFFGQKLFNDGERQITVTYSYDNMMKAVCQCYYSQQHCLLQIYYSCSQDYCCTSIMSEHCKLQPSACPHSIKLSLTLTSLTWSNQPESLPQSFASGSSKVTNCMFKGREPGDEASFCTRHNKFFLTGFPPHQTLVYITLCSTCVIW